MKMEEEIYIDKNDNIFPDHMGANSEIELFIKLSKDMDNTDTTKPKKYKELGDKYYIFHLKDKRKLSEYKILEPYRLYRYENRRKEIIENLDIKYIYPEIELEKDFFARETKVAEVNGKDIYLDNWNINIYKYSNGMTKEELIESINMEIMMELREQDVYKKYYKEKEYDIDNLTEIERENIYESYSKYMHDILKIEEYELEKYIEENREKLISYEYIDFNYTGKDSNEIYNRLLKDNSANIIADIFENRYNRNINLSEKEKEILESFYFNKDISSSFFKKSLDGMSFELEKKYPNGYYKFYQNDYHIETSLQDYEDLKKMELKELSELKPIHKDFDNNYKLILLYNKIDDEDSIIKLAKEYLRIEKENDYVKELFEKADIKYFIE